MARYPARTARAKLLVHVGSVYQFTSVVNNESLIYMIEGISGATRAAGSGAFEKGLSSFSVLCMMTTKPNRNQQQKEDQNEIHDYLAVQAWKAA
jgi:hypothetical protein